MFQVFFNISLVKIGQFLLIFNYMRHSKKKPSFCKLRLYFGTFSLCKKENHSSGSQNPFGFTKPRRGLNNTNEHSLESLAFFCIMK